MVALYHFDMPLHLAEKYNGFINKHVVDLFVAFGKKMIDVLGDRVTYWLTFNEQNLYSMAEDFQSSGYLNGERTLRDLYQISHNIMLAHAKIANYIHDNKPKLQIGGMEAYSEVYLATPNPDDVAAVRRFKEFTNNNLIRLFTEGKYSDEVVAFMKDNGLSDILVDQDLKEMSYVRSDFFSFSFYATKTIDSTKIPIGTAPNYYVLYGEKKNPYLKANEWGWQIDPVGFENVLIELSNRLSLPIFPIENGIGVREAWDGKHPINDDYRIDYMRSHIQAVKNAVQKGVNVIGYLGWGLIDIPSSAGNVNKRYGVVYVNRSNHDLKDLKRVPKKSYY